MTEIECWTIYLLELNCKSVVSSYDFIFAFNKKGYTLMIIRKMDGVRCFKSFHEFKDVELMQFETGFKRPYIYESFEDAKPDVSYTFCEISMVDAL